MRAILQLVAFVVILSCCIDASYAQSGKNCDVFKRTLFYDVKASPWGQLGDNNNGRVLHVLAAPWCKPCKNLINAYLKVKPSFDIRVTPITLTDRRHRNQAVDMVLGGADGIVRVYTGQNSPDYERDQLKKIDDLIVNFSEGVRDRLAEDNKTLGSPFGFFAAKSGYSAVPLGNRDLADAEELLGMLDEDIVADESKGPDIGIVTKFLAEPVKVERGQNNTAIVGQEGALVYSFPSTTAPSALCMSPGQSFDIEGRVEPQGEEYFLVRLFRGEDVDSFLRSKEVQLRN